MDALNLCRHQQISSGCKKNYNRTPKAARTVALFMMTLNKQHAPRRWVKPNKLRQDLWRRACHSQRHQAKATTAAAAAAATTPPHFFTTDASAEAETSAYQTNR
jgi:hypothetical protein